MSFVDFADNNEFLAVWENIEFAIPPQRSHRNGYFKILNEGWFRRRFRFLRAAVHYWLEQIENELEYSPNM